MNEIGGVTKAMATDKDVWPLVEIETLNDYALSFGHNLPNHSTSIKGLGAFVRQNRADLPTFRTQQAAYRYAAWLITMAEVHLPNEEGCEEHTFEVVRDAIHNA